MALTIPLAYLLSIASFLPALLGVFFYILFGLIVSAGLYRVWSPLQPMSRNTVRWGVTVVVLAGWGGSLVWEGVTFPKDVAKKAIEQVVKVEGKTGADVRADAIRDTNAYLAEHYPPGGVIGYWRWALVEDEIDIPITGVKAEDSKPIKCGEPTWWVLLRVSLCGIAFSLACNSLVGPLTKPVPDPEDREFPSETSDIPASGEGAMGNGDDASEGGE